MKRLVPVLVDCMREGYSLKKFLSDVMAGILVGILALSLAIGFAIASGVRPEQGLVTAIVAGAAIALLGGSRVQVSGPTGAFVVVVASIVDQHGYPGLALATFMAGALLILMGWCGLGRLLRLIPDSIVYGFTAGIAVIIFTSQVPFLAGLHIEKLPPGFIDKWSVILAHLPEANAAAIGCSLLAIVTALIMPRLSRSLPAPLVAVVLVTVLVNIVPLGVETIGSRFGGLPTSLPEPALPFQGSLLGLFSTLNALWYPVLAIALLGGIESLLSARVADKELGGPPHKPDAELVAQGVGNMLSPLFGGIPATGAFARTATNIRSGGLTPISSVVHALFLVAVLVWMGQLIATVPMCGLAGVLAVVSYHMGKWDHCIKYLRKSKGEGMQLLATFLATVLIDLMAGLAAGLIVCGVRYLILRKRKRSERPKSCCEIENCGCSRK